MDFKNKQTKAKHISSIIKKQIEEKTFKAGMKLPSIRAAAVTFSASTSTIVEAYEYLVSENFVTAKPGVGFYIRNMVDLQHPSLDHLDLKIAPYSFFRHVVHSNSYAYKPGCASLHETMQPIDIIRTALRQVSNSAKSMLGDYQHPLGYEPLRKLLSERLHSSKLYISADQINLVDSASHALDIICRMFLNDNDTVLVDDPTSFDFKSLIKLYNVNVVSVPCLYEGRGLLQFEQVLKDKKPRLYLCNSILQNPTSRSMTPKEGYSLLTLANKYNLIIVEDDVFSNFERPSSTTRLAALDNFKNVIYLSSFSKTISGSIRCGYIVANKERSKKIAQFRLESTFGGSNISSQVIYNILKGTKYRRWLSSTLDIIFSQKQECIHSLEKLGFIINDTSTNGIFVWAKLPAQINAIEFSRSMYLSEIILAPGQIFSPAKNYNSHIRFNVTHTNYPAVLNALEKTLSIYNQ